MGGADRAGRTLRVAADAVGADAPAAQAVEQLVAVGVDAHRRDDVGTKAELAQVVGDVERRAAGEAAVGQEIPEDFAVAGDDLVG